MEESTSLALFRTRGNHFQGMGDLHVTKALADEFVERGWKVAVLAEPDAEAVSFCEDSGLSFYPSGTYREDWELAQRLNPDCLVFSILNNDKEYLTGFLNKVRMLVTVDDDGEAAAHADLRINPLYPCPDSYSDLSYAILKPELIAAKEEKKIIRDEVGRILITLGGADTHGFTPSIVKTLSILSERLENFPFCEIILGSAFGHEEELSRAVEHLPEGKYSIARCVNNMPMRIVEADMIICAGGITLLEAACLGTPAIVVCGEPFEEQTAARLEELGFGVNLGFHNPPEFPKIVSAVSEMLFSHEMRRQISLAGSKLIDGRGASRIVKMIIEACRKVEVPNR